MDAGTHFAIRQLLAETIDLLIFRIATLFTFALDILASVYIRIAIRIEVVVVVAKDTWLPAARGGLRKA